MRFVISLMILLFSGLVNAQNASYYDLFKTFTAMKNPQSHVPVGAKWLPEIGPVGDGEPEENLIASNKGLSTGVISSSLKNQITLSLINYLGLGIQTADLLTVSFNDLTFTRVKDITKLSRVRAGDQVIFQAVKAGTITIKTNEITAANIQATAIDKGIVANLVANSESDAEVILNGSELYIAYQVIQLGKAKVKQKTKTHNGDEITIYDNRIRFCQCDVGTPLTIEVQNLKSADLSGYINTQKINFDPDRDRLREYSLEPIFTGSSVIATNIIFKYLVHQKCSPIGATKDGKELTICEEKKFPKKYNKVSVTTTEVNVKPVKDPVAPF